MLFDEGDDVLHRFDQVLAIEPIIDLVIINVAGTPGSSFN
jgi:hypothetical protein